MEVTNPVHVAVPVVVADRGTHAGLVDDDVLIVMLVNVPSPLFRKTWLSSKSDAIRRSPSPSLSMSLKFGVNVQSVFCSTRAAAIPVSMLVLVNVPLPLLRQTVSVSSPES